MFETADDVDDVSCAAVAPSAPVEDTNVDSVVKTSRTQNYPGWPNTEECDIDYDVRELSAVCADDAVEDWNKATGVVNNRPPAECVQVKDLPMSTVCCSDGDYDHRQRSRMQALAVAPLTRSLPQTPHSRLTCPPPPRCSACAFFPVPLVEQDSADTVADVSPRPASA